MLPAGQRFKAQGAEVQFNRKCGLHSLANSPCLPLWQNLFLVECFRRHQNPSRRRPVRSLLAWMRKRSSTWDCNSPSARARRRITRRRRTGIARRRSKITVSRNSIWASCMPGPGRRPGRRTIRGLVWPGGQSRRCRRPVSHGPKPPARQHGRVARRRARSAH